MASNLPIPPSIEVTLSEGHLLLFVKDVEDNVKLCTDFKNRQPPATVT
jgi:hypothetical protein